MIEYRNKPADLELCEIRLRARDDERKRLYARLTPAEQSLVISRLRKGREMGLLDEYYIDNCGQLPAGETCVRIEGVVEALPDDLEWPAHAFRGLTPGAKANEHLYKIGTTILITHTGGLRNGDFERWVKLVAQDSGQVVDWHYAAGRAVVKALGDIEAVMLSAEYLAPLWPNEIMW